MAEFKVGTAKSRHPWLQRWWLQCEVLNHHYTGEKKWDVYTFKVPWWAWPLELTHRLVFGRTKFESPD